MAAYGSVCRRSQSWVSAARLRRWFGGSRDGASCGGEQRGRIGPLSRYQPRLLGAIWVVLIDSLGMQLGKSLGKWFRNPLPHRDFGRFPKP
jgi:hypothetical protein